VCDVASVPFQPETSVRAADSQLNMIDVTWIIILTVRPGNVPTTTRRKAMKSRVRRIPLAYNASAPVTRG
jgi:hypothetical protein